MSIRATGFHLMLLALCAGCGCPREPDLYEIAYGTTRYVPMIGVPAADFIGNDVEVVPAAIGKCGGLFIAFNGRTTDGGEAAYFSADDQAAVRCIGKTLPAGRIELAPALLTAELRRRAVEERERRP